jgi:hypothetical protein
MVLLAQRHDQIARGGLLGLLTRAVQRREKELGIGIAAELMTQDAE